MEFNLKLKRKKLKEDIDYLFSKLNFANSFLDAKAITIMNEFWKDLIESDKEFIRLLKEELQKELHCQCGICDNNKSGERLKQEINKLAGEKND